MYLLVCPVPRRQRLHRRVRPLPPAGLEGRRAVGDEAGGGWLQDEAKEEDGGGEDEAWWRRAHGTSPPFSFRLPGLQKMEKKRWGNLSNYVTSPSASTPFRFFFPPVRNCTKSTRPRSQNLGGKFNFPEQTYRRMGEMQEDISNPQIGQK